MSVDEPTLTVARLGRLLENTNDVELSLPQYRVLGLLSTGDERATQLAARVAVTKPTLTAIVDSLVERGYVRRETTDGDRRAVRLSITPEGRDAVQRTGAQLREVLDDVVGRCERPDEVLAALEQLQAALDARWAERVRMQAEQQMAAAERGERAAR
jgi:DNA-binding MarR family transcriptional regulator